LRGVTSTPTGRAVSRSGTLAPSWEQ